MSNSKIYLGSTNLGTGKIRLGANDVSAIYLGSSLLYPPSGPTPPTPTPTLVDYVHTSTASLTANYINTGIYPTTDTVFRVVFKPNQKMGNCIVGYDFTGAPDSQKSTPTGASSDNTDYRLINYSTNNKMHLDFNNSRIEKTMSTDSGGYIDITCGNNYITDDISQSTQTGTTQSSMATQNVPIYLNVSSDLDFQSLEIWENNTKVYDGHAAVLNGTYGVYDSVGGTFTTQTYGGNSMNGGNIAPDINDALCFTAEQANSTVGLTIPSGLNLTLYKSTDGANFDSWDGTTVTLNNIGDTLWVYGTNQTISTSSSSYTKFVMTGRIAAAGDVTYLFQNGGLTTVPNSYGLYGLFQDCRVLTTPPEIPITTLTNGCYEKMFENCYLLTQAPQLPVTTLTDFCYDGMFANCRTLAVAPELPATTLAAGCYAYMFVGCTSLTQSPILQALTIAPYAYYQMFDGCVLLNTVTCLATDISATNATPNWLYGVAQTGTFYKSPDMSSWTTGTSGIPSGWTVVDA